MDNFITKSEYDNHAIKMSEKLDELKNNIYEIKILLATMPKQIIDECDSRYASKISEKVVYSMVGLVLTAFMGSLIYLVIK